MCAPEFLSCPTSYKLHLKWVWAQTHHQPSTNLEPLHTPSKPLAPNIKKSDKMVFQMVTLSPSQSFIIFMEKFVLLPCPVTMGKGWGLGVSPPHLYGFAAGKPSPL